MLTGLAIREIVLIESLDLDFSTGLTVLTGETGAGKSIVLDALGLALGARADRGLVRNGASQGSVTAYFQLDEDHPAHAILSRQDVDIDGEIVVRRTLNADGRSRAFVNDQPVGTNLLKELGRSLIEVHGQMDQHGLLDVQTHKLLLDEAGGHAKEVERVRSDFKQLNDIEKEIATRRAEIEKARLEEDYLRHRALELEDLGAKSGEEEALAQDRQKLMAREKLLELYSEVLGQLNGGGAAIERLGQAQRRLDRGGEAARELLQPAIDALERALIEAEEAVSVVQQAEMDLHAGGLELEEVEDRLFGLRDMARKHRVSTDELPDLLETTRRALETIDAGSDHLADLERARNQARTAFDQACEQLTKARIKAAKRLEQAVHQELSPLRLDKTRFSVVLAKLDEPSADGGERVSFEVSTNPGQPFGPLSKIASGGELSRLMLALKVVMGRGDRSKTMIFDEVDAGIGGATADAVGERLAELAAARQVIVVTHAPQVAARADHHLTVAKSSDGGRTGIDVRTILADQRRDEIARMLAGAKITNAARAAAESLMAAGARG